MRSTRRLALSFAVPVTLVAGLLAPSAAHATPPPTRSASILSPSSGERVGQDGVLVDAQGLVTNPTTNDTPESLSLYVDGAFEDEETCNDATATSCETTLYWDTSVASLGTHQLTVELTTSLATSAPSAPISLTVVVAAAAQVTLTSPSPGATVTGAITVTAAGQVDGATDDYPAFMGLFVDGDPVGYPVQCPAAGLTCTTQLPWNATALSGPHVLQVIMVTHQTYEFSNQVSVSVFNPPPTASIDVAVGGQTVRGVVTLTGHGTITPAESDSPVDLQLVVDGVPYGQPVPCQITPATTRSCTQPLPWDTTGLLGPHNVQVRFDTLRAHELSPVGRVTVLAPLSRPGETVLTVGGAYANGVLSARVDVHDAEENFLAGVPVSVTFTPAVGAPVTVQGTTDVHGVLFVGAQVKKVNTKIVASLGPDYGSPQAVTTTSARIAVTCAVPATVHHAVKAHATCKMPGLANGTVITLYSGTVRSPHVLARAKAKSGKATFTFSIAKKAQRLTVWAVVPSTKAYLGASSRTSKLHVI